MELSIKDLIPSYSDYNVTLLSTKNHNKIMNYVKDKLKKVKEIDLEKISLKLLKLGISEHHYPEEIQDNIPKSIFVDIFYNYEGQDFNISNVFYNLFKDDIYNIYRGKDESFYWGYYKDRLNKEKISFTEIINYDKISLKNNILGHFEYINN